MHRTSKTTKTLAALTVAGALTLGGASAAFAADASAGASGTGGGAAAGRAHPGAFRSALRAAAMAAADALGMTPRELRAAVLDGPQSVASVVGDRAPEVTAAVESALNARIDEAEANGAITAEQAAKLRDRVPTAAARFMERVPAGRGA